MLDDLKILYQFLKYLSHMMHVTVNPAWDSKLIILKSLITSLHIIYSLLPNYLYNNWGGCRYIL